MIRGGVPRVIQRGYPTGNTYEAVNVTNVPTVIRRITVPRGRVWGPNLLDALVVRLPFAETVAFAGTHVLTDTTYRIARVPELNDAQSTDGDFQDVVLLADGTARAITEVTDHIDGVTGQLKCSDDSAADHRACYLPYAAGELMVYAKVPGSMGDQRRLLIRRSIQELHAANQENEGKLRLPCLLPEDFMIEVELTAVWVWAWVTGATGTSAALEYAQIDIPVEDFPLEQFAVRGEKRIGDALKVRARQIIAGL